MDIKKIQSAAIALRDNNCEENYIEHINQSCPVNVLELIAQREMYARQAEEYQRKYQREHIDTNRWKNRAELAEARIEVAENYVSDKSADEVMEILSRRPIPAQQSPCAQDLINAAESSARTWQMSYEQAAKKLERLQKKAVTIPYVDVTDDMIHAAFKHSKIGGYVRSHWTGADDAITEIFKVMLDAAPKPSPAVAVPARHDIVFKGASIGRINGGLELLFFTDPENDEYQCEVKLDDEGINGVIEALKFFGYPAVEQSAPHITKQEARRIIQFYVGSPYSYADFFEEDSKHMAELLAASNNHTCRKFVDLRQIVGDNSINGLSKKLNESLTGNQFFNAVLNSESDVVKKSKPEKFISSGDAITIAELKAALKGWPEIDEYGNPCEVWIGDGALSNEAREIWPLNYRTSEDETEAWADLIISPAKRRE